MKKIICVLISILILAGCENPDEQVEKNDFQNKEVLVVYYSLSGNTKKLAQDISTALDADTYEIQTKVPFPAEMTAADNRAREERTTEGLPELVENFPDFNAYDLILVGGPVWSDTLSTPVESFLAINDFAENDVAPFYTYASDSGNYQSDFAIKFPSTVSHSGLGLSSAELSNDTNLAGKIDEWLLQMDVEDNPVQADKIVIQTETKKIEATLNNSKAAEEFKEQLPQTISMRRMGDHEYYGQLEAGLTHQEPLTNKYEIGDLAFWTPGDLFAIYFDYPDEYPEGLMVLGEITSDLEAIKELSSTETMTIELVD